MNEEKMMQVLINNAIKEYMKKNVIRTVITGTITSDDTGTYSVLLDGDDIAATDIPAVSGLTISVNDKVLMSKINGSTTNLIITHIL